MPHQFDSKLFICLFHNWGEFYTFKLTSFCCKTRAGKSVARTPGASIFSCRASADHLPVGACAFLRWKFAKYMCAYAWWASQLKKLFSLLRTYTYNPRCKAGCECHLRLKPIFQANPTLRYPLTRKKVFFQVNGGIHVFRTPLSPSQIFFLGKSAWILESDGWFQKFTNRNSGFNSPIWVSKQAFSRKLGKKVTAM